MPVPISADNTNGDVVMNFIYIDIIYTLASLHTVISHNAAIFTAAALMDIVKQYKLSWSS